MQNHTTYGTNPLGQERLIRSGPLKEWLGCCDMTLWRKQRDQHLPFPAPITLGGPIKYWRIREVEDWIKAKAEADAAKATANGRLAKR